MTSSAPYLCESIAYWGMSSPKKVARLNSPSLLYSSRRIIRTRFEGLQGSGSRSISSRRVGMHARLFVELGEDVGLGLAYSAER